MKTLVSSNTVEMVLYFSMLIIYLYLHHGGLLVC